jgi:outer membrane translocation and assembly module TamA
VLAARALYGRALSGHLPVTERFFGGGPTGHRGFGHRELSPFIVDDEAHQLPIGGDELALGSAEARVDVTKVYGFPFGLVGFFDTGDVVAEVGSLDLGHLHDAVGIGLRWNPVIAVRADLGYRLDRYGPGEPQVGHRFALQISLGQAF